jgi:uncharacterized protein Veg
MAIFAEVEVGGRYIIGIKSDKRNKYRVKKVEVIFKTDKYFTVKGRFGIRESFTFADVLTQTVKVRRAHDGKQSTAQA